MSKLRDDLSLISKLSDEQFQQIINTTNGNKQVEWAVHLDSFDSDLKPSAEALYKLVETLGDAFSNARDFDKEVIELDEVVNQLVKDDVTAITGWQRVKSAYESLDPYFLKKKEEVLKSRFSRVVEISLTIDARPVFSLNKTKVEKILYPYILKLDVSDEKSFLCELYDEQLDLLEEEIKILKAKRAIFQGLLLSKETPDVE